jgi:hypothetical protein
MTVRRILAKWYFIVILLVFSGISLDSCQSLRYKNMIKKRRTGHTGAKRHKSTYQKKLNKRTTTTNSKYVIDNKRNYRRKPWYGN